MLIIAAAIRGLLIASILLPAVGGAVTFTVDVPIQDAPDAVPGDGICSYDENSPDDAPVCTLRAAVMEANATDAQEDVAIVLTPGQTYELTIPGIDENFAATGDLDIRRRMTIGVPDPAAAKAKIDATGKDRAFEFFQANDSTLEGIEITGGFVSDGYGTAIIFPFSNQKITLDFLDIHDNQSSSVGPGFRCAVQANAKLRDSHVHHNGSEEVGMRGVCNFGSGLTIVRSTIDHNSSAGINVQEGSLWLHTSTVSENGAAGLFLLNADAVIYGSTIARNEGRQILFAANGQASKSLGLSGSILESVGTNACDIYQGDDSELTFTTAWNLYSDDSCLSDVFFDHSKHNATLNLSELGDGGGPTPTHLPLSGSDAIDFAPASVCDQIGTDQRGLPRPVAQDGMLPALCDIGAVEVQPVPVEDAMFSNGFEAD